MADLIKIPVTWTGLTGLPGVTIFHALSASTTAVTNVVAFFNALRGLFPNTLSWQVPGSGDMIDVASGDLSGTWSMAGSASVAANGVTATYAAGVGARVRWLTAGIVHNRRLRGSTFLTSMATSQYDGTGTLQSSTITTIQTAATTLAGTGDLVVYSRPFAGAPGNPARLGTFNPILSATVPDQVTSLRSRRT